MKPGTASCMWIVKVCSDRVSWNYWNRRTHTKLHFRSCICYWNAISENNYTASELWEVQRFPYL